MRVAEHRASVALFFVFLFLFSEAEAIPEIVELKTEEITKKEKDEFPQKAQPSVVKRVTHLLVEEDDIEMDHLEIFAPQQDIKKAKSKLKEAKSNSPNKKDSPNLKYGSSPEKERKKSPREDLNRKRPYDSSDELRRSSDNDNNDKQSSRSEKKSTATESDDLRKRLLLKKLGNSNKERDSGPGKSRETQENPPKERDRERYKDGKERERDRDKDRKERIKGSKDSKDKYDRKRKVDQVQEKHESKESKSKSDRSSNETTAAKTDSTPSRNSASNSVSASKKDKKDKSKRHEEKDKSKKKKKRKHKESLEKVDEPGSKGSTPLKDEIMLEKSPEEIPDRSFDDISSVEASPQPIAIDNNKSATIQQESKSPIEKSPGTTSNRSSGDASPPMSIGRSPSRSPTPERSPTPVRKRTYFPAIEGCRNVEEFSWLNRIEEGTYGVVYRAKDRRSGNTKR